MPCFPSDESPALALVHALLEFRQAGFRHHAPGELGRTEFALLFALHKDGGETGLRISDLVKRLESSPPTMTQTTSSLARVGLVERIADPDDRRGVRIVLTEAGRATVLNRKDQFHAHCCRLAEHLGAEEARQFAALLSKSARFFHSDPLPSSKESRS